MGSLIKLLDSEHSHSHFEIRQESGYFLNQLEHSPPERIFHKPSQRLSQIPSYAKFLKEILFKKRRLEDYETVALIEECSTILQNKLPSKLKDPGSFSISCLNSNMNIDKALCDLGANRSVKYPVGILENIPIKVGKFFIPIDFIILEMEEDVQILILLGRPFLATAGAIINVKNGRLTLKVGDEEVEFNLCRTMKYKSESDKCSRVDIIDKLVEEEF
ncbi:uncharacterized protein LOC131174588 [Hevea brasiliensis]|uniref:uncharacterized protein LOC131174588 n=1 Tax=Hevea brasiliensis TaxID=3981 RepID=UPI0025E62F99|nr:uncharacterized protein LOC131174588 [Hevea brasiliensis]